MTKHALGAGLACAAVLAAVGAVTVPAASAAGGIAHGGLARGCVTDREYNSVRTGMTRVRVHNLIGTTGLANAGGPRMQARIYDKCGPSEAWVHLTFRHRDDGSWRLTEKSADPE